jgi:hypothetical protein
MEASTRRCSFVALCWLTGSFFIPLFILYIIHNNYIKLGFSFSERADDTLESRCDESLRVGRLVYWKETLFVRVGTGTD